MTFSDIIFYYLLPTIYSSAAALIFAFFFLSIFRVKDPNIRIAFFFIPLIKPFLSINEKIDIGKLYYYQEKIGIGFKFFNPRTLTVHFDIYSISTTQRYVLFMVILHTLIFLIIKWLYLAIVYRKFIFEENTKRSSISQLYFMVDELAARVDVPPPKICISNKNYYSPYVIGVKNIMIVIPAQLLKCLNYSEKQTLILHEIIHIKRKDNLIGRIALILKDLLYFNPVGYFAFWLIRAEQERCCDLLVVKYSGKKNERIARDILNSIIKIKNISKQKIGFTHMNISCFISSKITCRRLCNRIENILKVNKDKIFSRLISKILLYLLAIFIFFSHIVITFNIGSYVVVLK